MLPKGWHRTPLGSIASIERGKFSVRPRNDPRYFGGNIPFVQTGDVANAGMYLTNYSQTLNSDGLAVSKLFPTSTILMTIAANIGHTAITKFPVTAPDSVVGINAFPNKADPIWLKYALEAQQPILDSLAVQNAQKNINLQTLNPLEILAPGLEEQRRIGKVLLAWDQAEGAMKCLIANSRKQMLALLGRTLNLLPANLYTSERATNGGYPASVQSGIPQLPPAPKGWRTVTLGEFLHEVRHPANLEPDREYTLVTVKRSRGGMQQREILLGAQIKTPTQFFVKAGDFLISKRQIVHGACGIVPVELDGAIVSNEYAVLNSNGLLDLGFLRYLSESRYFQQTCFHSSIGVHVEKMIFNTERWLSWPFNIPPLDQQRHIVEILDAASEETFCFERQSVALKSEKQALMSVLLTGKRRVRLPESAKDAAA